MKRLAFLTLLAAFACGDNIEFQPDADMTPDADLRGTCGVSLQVGASDLADILGAPVVFSSADGSLLGVESLDKNGEASFAECEPDTQVTFIIDTNANLKATDTDDFVLYTYTHVQPGDTIAWRNGGLGEFSAPDPDAFANVAFNQDTSAVTEEAYMVGASVGCDSVTQSADVEGVIPPFDFLRGTQESPVTMRGCNTWGASDPDFDVLAWVTGAGSDSEVQEGGTNVVGYAFLKDQPLMRGTLEEPTEHPVALGPWIAGNLDNAFILTNAPFFDGGYSSVGLYQAVDYIPHAAAEDSFNRGLPVQSWVFRGLPADYGEQSIVSATWGHYNGPYWTDHGMFWRTPFSRTVFADLSGALPTIAAMAVTDPNPTQPTFEWFLNDSAATDRGNLAIFQLRLFNGDDGGEVFAAAPGVSYGSPNNSEDTIEWFVITPNVGASSITLPELPAQYSEIIGDFADSAIAWFASLFDVPGSYSDIISSPPGFDPEEAMSMPYYMPYRLPDPNPDADRAVRYTTWSRYGNPE